MDYRSNWFSPSTAEIQYFGYKTLKRKLLINGVYRIPYLVDKFYISVKLIQQGKLVVIVHISNADFVFNMSTRMHACMHVHDV